MRHQERGDTIMEVLISMAVLGLILASAFTLANRSTSGNISAAERGQASSLSEQQLELLKIYMNTGGISVPTQGSAFCLTVDTASGDITVHSFTNAPEDDPNADKEFVDYPTECTGFNGLFNFYIVRGTATPGSPNDINTYAATTRWLAVAGGNVNEAVLTHKLYRNEQ